MTFSLCYEGRFRLWKDSLFGWCIARGRAMAMFPTWERAWWFMFGVLPREEYPGQAYFHEHNANVKHAETK